MLFERYRFLKRKRKLEKEKTRKKNKRPRKLIWSRIGNAILYASDLFILLMIITWIFYIVVSLPAAWLELIKYGSTGIFNDLKEACVLPLSVGGAIWLIRISITHHSANKNGKRLTPDFPNLDSEGNVVPLELDSEEDAMMKNSFNKRDSSYGEEPFIPDEES